MIKSIEIKNFKCFENFKISEFKRVNLITGRNNIGKTALLETIFLNSKKNYINVITTLREIFDYRKNYTDIDIFKDISMPIELISNKNNLKIEIIKNTFPLELKINNYSFEIENLLNGNLVIKSKNSFGIEKNNSNFLSFCRIENQMMNFYASLVENMQEEYLKNSLKEFDNEIEDVKLLPINNNIVFKIQKDKKLLPLASFGDGFKRFMAIICALWASKDGYLFIDEIENGIHYKEFNTLWKIIFDIAKKANIQVFATTHSYECIKSFNEIDDGDGTLIELYKAKNKILFKNRDKEQLRYSILSNGEYRGE